MGRCNLDPSDYGILLPREFLISFKKKQYEYQTPVKARLYCRAVDRDTRQICGVFVGRRKAETPFQLTCSACGGKACSKCAGILGSSGKHVCETDSEVNPLLAYCVARTISSVRTNRAKSRSRCGKVAIASDVYYVGQNSAFYAENLPLQIASTGSLGEAALALVELVQPAPSMTHLRNKHIGVLQRIRLQARRVYFSWEGRNLLEG
ncbi:hypothetical protein AC578_7929 [Pseudocercospora eumusae]|uniref:IBR domain-containing protein n=1 Tax=Pseudocercospora eumusae TaxID=321146 RepID=A0A139HPM3_9PEZI|nr:hypothetical protein AC578_7929 [Pseudocercospora eumusae]